MSAHQTPPATQPTATVGEMLTEAFTDLCSAAGALNIATDGEERFRNERENVLRALKSAVRALHTPPPVATATVVDAIHAVTANMRQMMPNACGDWANEIDAALVSSAIVNVQVAHGPAIDGLTLMQWSNRLYDFGPDLKPEVRDRFKDKLGAFQDRLARVLAATPTPPTGGQ